MAEKGQPEGLCAGQTPGDADQALNGPPSQHQSACLSGSKQTLSSRKPCAASAVAQPLHPAEDLTPSDVEVDGSTLAPSVGLWGPLALTSASVLRHVQIFESRSITPTLIPLHPRALTVFPAGLFLSPLHFQPPDLVAADE